MVKLGLSPNPVVLRVAKFSLYVREYRLASREDFQESILTTASMGLVND